DLTVTDVSADGTFAVLGGITNTGAGSVVRLQSAGDLGQTATGLITADTLGVRAAGYVSLVGLNAVNTFAADAVGGDRQGSFRTPQALTVGAVSAAGNFAAVSGVTATGFTAGGASGVVRLQAAGGLGQTATGLIRTRRLGVRNFISGDI